MSTTAGKSTAEIERANRMFSVESALKAAPEDKTVIVPMAREIFEFLQENDPIGYNPTGFGID